MRKQILAAVLLVAAGSAIAVNNPSAKPSFADLTWYANPNIIKQQMRVKGYNFEGDVKDSGAVDSIFSGKLLGIPVDIRLWFNNNKQLSKTSVIFKKTYDTNLYSDWKMVGENITAKYGLGGNLTNISSYSMQSQFSLERELGEGKTVQVIWPFSTYSYAVSLEIDKAYTNDNDYYLVLAYESPNWSKELERRRKSSDF